MSDGEDVEVQDQPLDTAAKNRELDNMAFNREEYEMIQREFHKFLSEIQQNKQLDKFKEQYENIYGLLNLSYNSEKELIKKCKDLNKKISSKAQEVKHSLKISNDDMEKIEQLKEKVNKTYSEIEKMKVEEGRQ
jgi:hypothetical protein